jgi:uncharacterized protein YutE (UPF0331/DUF86 family)
VARLGQIRTSLQRLQTLRSTTPDEFVRNYLISSTAERELQVAIQAAIDVAQIILADMGAPTPRDYAHVFEQLGLMKVCPPALTRRLAPMARFRNVLVNLYLEVDLTQVYETLQSDSPDLEEYARCIADFLLTQGEPGAT